MLSAFSVTNLNASILLSKVIFKINNVSHEASSVSNMTLNLLSLAVNLKNAGTPVTVNYVTSSCQASRHSVILRVIAN